MDRILLAMALGRDSLWVLLREYDVWSEIRRDFVISMVGRFFGVIFITGLPERTTKGSAFWV